MKNRKIAGLAVALLGLLIFLVPVAIFPPCTALIETASGGTTPMKCHWTGQAEIGIGILILCGGVLLTVFQSQLIQIGISIMTALTGVLSLLVPTVLIGGCKMETMPCRAATFPALIVLSLLVIAVCAANVVALWQSNLKSKE